VDLRKRNKKEDEENRRGQSCDCTHLHSNRYERVFIELFKFYKNGLQRKRYC
jgi:hypothetical protein